MRVHGPLSGRCAGSGQFPLSTAAAVSLPSSPTRGPADTVTSSSTSLNLSAAPVDNLPSSPSALLPSEFDNTLVRDETQAAFAAPSETSDRAENSLSAFLDLHPFRRLSIGRLINIHIRVITCACPAQRYDCVNGIMY